MSGPVPSPSMKGMTGRSGTVRRPPEIVIVWPPAGAATALKWGFGGYWWVAGIGQGVPTPPDPQLAAIDRDDAAAEGALAKGDVEATLRYFDYFGHEQEDFARATLEYRLARQKLGEAVRESLGRRAWGRAARALGV